MGSSAFYVSAHVVVALLYGALAWVMWRALQTGGRTDARWFLPVLAAAHAGLLASAVIDAEGIRFGFAHWLSATLLFTVLVVWVEGFLVPIRGLLVIVLPFAAVATLLPAVFHGGQIAAAKEQTLAFRAHFIIAISAFSLLTSAAMHAGLMLMMDRSLHSASNTNTAFGRVLSEVPPLLALERLLFRLIWTGFLLLTATLASGVFFSELLFQRALRFDHKTTLAIASWLVFACLMVGRHWFGWRGRKALRWTLAGFAMLVLAYVGSRFVFEVVLHRM
jgi:ABC-type uncharacterized transport system permease subunit